MSRRLSVSLVLILLSTDSGVALNAQSRGTAVAPENLAGLAAGAIVVKRAKSADANGEAWFMFDEDSSTGWTSDTGTHFEPTVVELADRSLIRSLQFDTKNIETDGREPKQVLVEMSDVGASDGFRPIALVSLSAVPRDAQIFKTTADVPGRWLRVTIKSMLEGHTDSTSTPQHNQHLSEKRAGAVQQGLVAAGIDAARMTAVGFGDTKPVATNTPPWGARPIAAWNWSGNRAQGEPDLERIG